MEPEAEPLIESILFAVRAGESYYRPIALHVDGDMLTNEADSEGTGDLAYDDIENALRSVVTDHHPDQMDDGDGLFVWEGFPRHELYGTIGGGEVVRLRLDRGAKFRRATPADVQAWIDDVTNAPPSRPSSL